MLLAVMNIHYQNGHLIVELRKKSQIYAAIAFKEHCTVPKCKSQVLPDSFADNSFCITIYFSRFSSGTQPTKMAWSHIKLSAVIFFV